MSRIVWLFSLVLGYSRHIFARFVMHQDLQTLLRCHMLAVRLQMVWDNLRCFGTEALARLGLRLGGFQLMLQSSQFDGVAFDPFSFQEDGSASAEIDVGRGQVL